MDWHTVTDFDKRLELKFKYEKRGADSLMGRHGGGWHIKVGLQTGKLTRKRGCMIFSLWDRTLRIGWEAPDGTA